MSGGVAFGLGPLENPGLFSSHRQRLSRSDVFPCSLVVAVVDICDAHEHFSPDLLCNLVLLEDLGLRHGLIPQPANPHDLILIVSNERVDVLRNLVGCSATLFDVLFEFLDDPHNFLEIPLVGFDLLHQLAD